MISAFVLKGKFHWYAKRWWRVSEILLEEASKNISFTLDFALECDDLANCNAQHQLSLEQLHKWITFLLCKCKCWEEKTYAYTYRFSQNIFYNQVLVSTGQFALILKETHYNTLSAIWHLSLRQTILNTALYLNGVKVIYSEM